MMPETGSEAPQQQQQQQQQQAQPQLETLAITMEDFTAAVSRVQPSVRREGFATTPDVTWADVGALDEVRSQQKNFRAPCINLTQGYGRYMLASLIYLA